MTEDVQIKTAYDMLYLVSCEINDTKPDYKRVTNMDMEALCRISKYHNLAAIVYMSLERVIDINTKEDKLIKQWRELKDKAIRKNILLDVARNELFAYFEEKGIWYMPLKGIILKDIYIKPGMRQMADNDILFDSEYQQDVCRWFSSKGYEVESVGMGNHDVYKKKPVLNFEMHTSLFGKLHNPVWKEYYRNVWDRIIKDDNNRYGYHFSREDFYVFIVVHANKHYSGSGTGLRSLLDIYVYCKEYVNQMDWNYIDNELDALGVKKFEEMTRRMCFKIFGKEGCYSRVSIKDSLADVLADALSGEEKQMLSYIFLSGTYGKLKNYYINKLKKIQRDDNITWKTKLKYFFTRLFPDMDIFEVGYPFFYKHRWLLPIGVIYRLVRAIILRGKRLLREIVVVCETK